MGRQRFYSGTSDVEHNRALNVLASKLEEAKRQKAQQ